MGLPFVIGPPKGTGNSTINIRDLIWRPAGGGSSTNFCIDQRQSPPPSPPGTCPEEADAPGGYYPTPADTSAIPATCPIEF